jgi:hypothetical protein
MQNITARRRRDIIYLFMQILQSIFGTPEAIEYHISGKMKIAMGRWDRVDFLRVESPGMLWT